MLRSRTHENPKKIFPLLFVSLGVQSCLWTECSCISIENSGNVPEKRQVLKAFVTSSSLQIKKADSNDRVTSDNLIADVIIKISLVSNWSDVSIKNSSLFVKRKNFDFHGNLYISAELVCMPTQSDI